MKTYRTVEVKPHAFLTLTLDIYERSASYSGHLTLGKESLVPTGQEVEQTPEPKNHISCLVTETI
jgi:hypothetical protein